MKPVLLFNQYRILAILSAALLWAAGGVFFVPKLYHINVSLVVFLQHLIPTVALLGFILTHTQHRTTLKTMTRRTWFYFSLVSLLGGFIGTYAITQAFFNAYSAQISLSPIFFLQKLQPIFAIGAAVLMLKEPLNKKFWITAVLAGLGSYLLTFGITTPTFSIDNATIISASWAALAALSWGLSTTISKKSLQTVSPIIGTFTRFLLTSIIGLAMVFVLPDANLTDIKNITVTEWKLFALIAATTGGLALWLYYWGLKKVSASNSALYEMSMPLFALTLEQIIAPIILTNFNTPNISVAQILGGLILLGSISYLMYKKK